MDFSFKDLKTRLINSSGKPLPGEEAQYAMAPFERKLRAMESLQRKATRLSAVMILLYPRQGDTHTVLIVRNDYPGTHGGQIGFPGGKVEETDINLEQTALREMQEEVGWQAEQVRVVRPLTPLIIPPSGFLVHPFIGLSDNTPAFVPDPYEVAGILEVPLSTLLDDTIVKQKPIQLASTGKEIMAPYFDIDGHVVWGATAMMISEFKHLLHDLR
ncbi:MAG: CoA pyrophosphatase [Flavobacteriales bacterium]|nr:CoA pyrophosphatase [Flavobacteriales bacterium]